MSDRDLRGGVVTPIQATDCRDCHWAVTGAQGAPWDWACHAPPIVALLDTGNTVTPCRYAREFVNVCGAAGRHFRPRAGAINGCLSQSPAWANTGQDEPAHAPQS